MKAATSKRQALIFLGTIICFNATLSAQIASVTTDSLVSTPITYSYKKYLAPGSLIVPVSFIGYGFASLHTQPLRQVNKNIRGSVQEHLPGFATKVDDYLKNAPAASVFVLGAVGVKGRHEFLGKAVVYVISMKLCDAVVKRLKHATNELRPDGSTYNSFPSGHTATAFVGAEMMHQEYGSRSAWYSIAGYTMASGTALLRILNNRHWLRDVIAGAGIGMLSTKLGYWIYSKVEKKKYPARKLSY